MRIRVFFEKKDITIPFNNQHTMNGFVYSVLKNPAKYHDSFSNYSISSIQGTHITDDRKALYFHTQPYIDITSDNIGFITDFVNGLCESISSGKENFFGLRPQNFISVNMVLGPEYDLVKTSSPIIIKNKEGWKLTCDDENWEAALNKHCKLKLQHEGISDPTFRIEVLKASKKLINVGETFNPSTNALMIVRGKKETREKLYNLGIGNSTGSGFGSVEILNKKHAL